MDIPRSDKSDLIQLNNVRQAIKEGENHFNNHDFHKCICMVGRAKTWLWDSYNSLIASSETSIIEACGLSINDFNRFKSKIPAVTRLGDGNLLVVVKPNSQPNEEEAQFLLGFVTELALRIQNLV